MKTNTAIIKSFREKFKSRRDCSNTQKHILTCQGCIDVIVEEDLILEQFLLTALDQREREVAIEIFRDIKKRGWYSNKEEIQTKYLKEDNHGK